MAAHTPGPWYTDDAEEGYGVWSENTGAMVSITTRGLHYGTRQISEGEELSNARLIAAAPDLLAACTSAILQIGDVLRHADMSKAERESTEAVRVELLSAIRKAEGA